MNKRTVRLAQTAVMLALLICLQWVGGMIPLPLLKQLVTGSCVNAVLAAATLLAGVSVGAALALVSPVFAYLFGIAPPVILTVPLIMLGNLSYVLILGSLGGKQLWRQIGALAVASGVKFGVLYLLGLKVFGGLLFGTLEGTMLLGKPLMNQAVVKAMSNAFSWVQLVTALIGGALVLAIAPILRKALHK